ncbi:Calx-beta domain-containing protein [Bacteroides oleiciplenus]|uniref:Calx-beta domain-containing protein n=1 Tax=Bacteroides oleiciplenus TaxID=626931 RepID=A0A3E5BB10_9BACE|nr:Calx-beta domain-containing protein [Bacteroides oleiciplenus]RGN34545.1 hypothetical protein DXB65_12495 [Bacteroides oleiciplenus]
MKSIHVYLLAIATVLFAACSSDDDMNTTNVTVSFEQAEVSFAESAGLVTIPVKVEGERNGNIKVQLKITDGTAVSESHYIVTSDYIDIPADSDDTTFDVEVIVVDDGNTENDDRNFTITLDKIEGATVGTNGTCSVILRDVDKNPYFKLFGSWTLTAIDVVTGEAVSWDVNVSDDGEEEYAEKILVFSGYLEKVGSYVNDAVWAVSYSKSGNLEIIPDGIFYAAYNFGSFIGAACVTPMNSKGAPSTIPIPGTYNDTFDEIVFDTSESILGVKVHEYDTSTGDFGDYKGRLGNPYQNIRMVKK